MMTRSFLLVLGAAVLAAAAWLLSPLAETTEIVGRGGKIVEVRAGVRVVQPLKVPKEATAIAFAAAEVPPKGRLVVRFLSSVNGPALDETTEPRRVPEEEATRLMVPVPKPAVGRGVAVEFSLPGGGPTDLLRLLASARGRADEDSLHVFGPASAGRPLAEAQRPRALAFEVITKRPRVLILPRASRERWGMSAVLFLVGLLIVHLGRLGYAILPRISPRARRGVFVVGALLVLGAGLALRLWFAEHIPLVNDEQSFVYDALTANVSSPYIWKSPVLTVLEGIFLRAVGLRDVLTPRILTSLLGLCTAAVLALVAREIGGRAFGWNALVVALLFPTPAAYSSLVLSEQLLPLPLLAASLVILRARRRACWSMTTAGATVLLLALAVLTRHSGVFSLLGLALLARCGDRREYVRRVLALAVPFAVAAGAFFFLFPPVVEGFRTTQMIEDFVGRTIAAGRTKLSGWQEIFGSAVPLLALAGLATGGGKLRDAPRALLLGGLLLAAFVEPFTGTVPAARAPLLAAFVGVAVAGFFLPRVPKSRGLLLDLGALLLPPLLAYAIFPKVNPKNLAEFVPALVLFASLGAARLVAAVPARRRTAASVAAGFLLVLVGNATILRAERPYAGTLTFGAVRQAVAEIRARTKPSEPVFTAAVLLPLLAERLLAGGISRPAAEDPSYRGQPNPRFTQPLSPIIDQLQQQAIPLVVTDKLFADSFGRSPELRNVLAARYVSVTSVENPGLVPLTILAPRRDRDSFAPD